MEINGLFDKEAIEQFTEKMFKSANHLPTEWRYATLDDAPAIEKYIGRIIIEAFPSKYLLESMQEMMIRAGREISYYSHNAEIWHIITRYFKEKKLVDIYVIGVMEYVLIDQQLVLPLNAGRNVNEFSLRSEINEIYHKYAGERFIKLWEEKAFDSYEKRITSKYIEKICKELLEECVKAARKDLNIMLSHSFVTTIKGFYDFDKDTVEFHVVSRGGSYPASVYIKEDGYKTGIFKAKSKKSETQQAVVSVIFEDVMVKKKGYLIPLIRNYKREFFNLTNMLSEIE